MKINEETTVSEEQVLFNKLSYEDQELIIKIMKTLQPCELSCEVEEKKIPEKIGVKDYDKCIHDVTHKEKEFLLDIRELQIRYNDLLDYLKSKGE